jgi:hypothetical protein
MRRAVLKVSTGVLTMRRAVLKVSPGVLTMRRGLLKVSPGVLTMRRGVLKVSTGVLTMSRAVLNVSPGLPTMRSGVPTLSTPFLDVKTPYLRRSDFAGPLRLGASAGFSASSSPSFFSPRLRRALYRTRIGTPPKSKALRSWLMTKRW